MCNYAGEYKVYLSVPMRVKARKLSEDTWEVIEGASVLRYDDHWFVNHFELADDATQEIINDF